MAEFDSAGVKLHYETTGSGPELLLISGLGANRNAWAAALPELRERYTCITFDNRGTGQSDVPEGPYTIEQMSDDTAALIRHLGVGPVPAVGWSMGGVILQSLLIDHPDSVSKAVLLSTLPSYTDVQHAWLDGLLALRAAGADAITLAAAGIPWGFTPYTLVDHSAAYAALKLAGEDPEPTSDAGFAAQAQAIRTFDRRAQLHTISTPTLVLVGAEDILTPPRQAVEIAERIPGSRLVVLPRGSHGMLNEFPVPVLGSIEEFLAA
ncbi:alpha/beta fold hydrolase [Streptomyces sp. NPDC047009]|uniref:alpha/beta fold hydrolase n=1 Tax=unclassified Streptomyces TaxID=2593676 RepID=UPI003408CA88